MICGRFLLAMILAVALTGVEAADDVLQLPVGDPSRSERQAPVRLDAITDTHSTRLLDTSGLIERLGDVSILFFGEEHTNIDFHRAQAHLIRLLHEAGRQVLIGVEMFPYTMQSELDRWTRGQYKTDAEFLQAADWYQYWGYNWGYYEQIFRYARDNRIRVFGINAPRDVIKAVRTRGFESLAPEDAEHIPTRVEDAGPDHQRVYLAYFAGGDELHTQLPPEQLEGMIRAQATWDAVMAWNALQALRRHGGPNAIVVVLIGAGHAVYGVGAQYQIKEKFDGGVASIVPVPIRDHDGEAVDTVRASYADFVWGVPAARAPIYPQLGVSLAGSLGRAPNNIIQVEPGTAADAAGLLVGDQLLSLAGQAIEGPTELRRTMGTMDWGDQAEVSVRREEETIETLAVFRRKPDAD